MNKTINNPNKTAEEPPMTSDNSSTNWVHEVLEADQLSEAKRYYGRRKLGRGTLVLFWGLRVYVGVMIFLVILQIWNAFHPAK
jgi:hypothetical protein